MCNVIQIKIQILQLIIPKVGVAEDTYAKSFAFLYDHVFCWTLDMYVCMLVMYSDNDLTSILEKYIVSI